MKKVQQYSYWMALAHLPRWRTDRINRLIVDVIKKREMTLSDFFGFNRLKWYKKFDFNDKELNDLETAKKELPSYAFLVEDLLNQGFDIIPINSEEYPFTLKNNLKLNQAPPLIYVKGNKQILQENSIAIVGSRKADNISLQFTDNIAKLASEQYKVVVSGFAKGIDKQALESALKYKGQSIIVLPQGILTFGYGIKKYYKQIIEGDVLILSNYHPKANWAVGLAMARNNIIYGLAKEIYVAQSDNKGGTWSGVIDGLRKNREIYIRKPDSTEKNANDLLISKGAIPLDVTGKKLIDNNIKTNINSEQIPLEKDLIEILTDKSYTSKQIIDLLKINWTSIKMTNLLKSIEGIKIINNKPLKFTLKENKPENEQISIFDNLR
jgi:DNA protecting protein DprA